MKRGDATDGEEFLEGLANSKDMPLATPQLRPNVYTPSRHSSF